MMKKRPMAIFSESSFDSDESNVVEFLPRKRFRQVPSIDLDSHLYRAIELAAAEKIVIPELDSAKGGWGEFNKPYAKADDPKLRQAGKFEMMFQLKSGVRNSYHVTAMWNAVALAALDVEMSRSLTELGAKAGDSRFTADSFRESLVQGYIKAGMEMATGGPQSRSRRRRG